jgi:hypothetical protein
VRDAGRFSIVKSGKQRKKELLIGRAQRKAQERLAKVEVMRPKVEPGTAPCNPALFAPYNSYGQPAFATRGYYVDLPFTCRDCRVEQVWTATQQKWWYEVAKGYPYSGPRRCNACRRRVREAKAENKRRSDEGRQRKAEGKKRP